jgi:acetyl-CoA C-acetyltransferase
MENVFIVAAMRTPTGGFLGTLAGLSASELGAVAIKAAYGAAGVAPEDISSVYMGNVLSAGMGQSPARQASRYAGIPDSADATTVNKVCASGMKATMLGAQQIAMGLEDVVMTGGMESMSNAPHYTMLRHQNKLGDAMLTDGLLKDGLNDAYHKIHMGNIAEMTVTRYGISREQQDVYALQSYARAKEATAAGKLMREIVPVSVTTRQGTTLLQDDEDIYKIIPEKVSKLKPTFEKDGTITAANASNLNDGAAAILLASQAAIDGLGLRPLARVVAFADAAQAPEWFTTSPSLAINKALQLANMTLNDIDFLEINEAYAAVVLANQQLLGFDMAKTNVYGGAVAMGHPLGASGARILCTLLSVLKQEGGRYGLAAICNGGGGASAMIIEYLGG